MFDIISLIIVAYLFYLLGDLADANFCPSLNEIAKKLNLPEDVAGVTFLAVGNGAPDIASIFVSVVTAGSSGLGVGEPIGAGMVITTIVFGCCALFTKNLIVPPTQFLRDISFYILAVVIVFITVITKNVISIWESLLYLALYLVYVIVVIIWQVIFKKCEKCKEDNVKTKNEKTPLISEKGKNNGKNGNGLTINTDEECDEVVSSSDSFKKKKKKHHKTTSSKKWNNKTEFNSQFVKDHFKSNSKEEIYLSEVKEKSACYRYFYQIPLDYFQTETHWEKRSVLEKIMIIVNLPMGIIRMLTIPRSDPEEWSKTFSCLSLLFCPTFTLLVITKDPLFSVGVVPLLPFTILLGFILSGIVFFTSRRKHIPIYHFGFSFIEFVMAIIWIYIVANETVNLLETLGIMFHISESIIGVTLLSWGNSIGDLFADVTMAARKSKSHMAVTAIFAGPAMNLLIGLGIAVTILCIEQGTLEYKLGESYDMMLIMSFTILLISLISSMIIISCSKFRVSKFLGIYLIALFFAFLIIGVLIERGSLFPLIV